MMATNRAAAGAPDDGIVGASRHVFDAWERFAATGWAVALMFAWAFSEAIFWPLIPDVLLVLLVAGNRRRFYVPLAAAIVGSAAGGAALYLFAYWQPEQAADFLNALPLVTDSQIARATDGIADDGAAAFWLQPWSGVPFKVWAVAAGGDGVAPHAAIPIFIVARLARMAVFAALTACVVGVARPWVRDLALFILPAYVILFSYGWWQTQLAS
jgi:membrane protein YqaA with SNARE-associated domain